MTVQKNILVIDDDPVFKLIAKKLLERCGKFSHIHFLDNGKDGIEYLKNILDTNAPTLPDIILLDIEMPVMNGWDFMNEFVCLPAEKRNGIAVYTVSSSIASEDMRRAASYPDIKSYITKPLTMEIIQTIVNY